MACRVYIVVAYQCLWLLLEIAGRRRKCKCPTLLSASNPPLISKKIQKERNKGQKERNEGQMKRDGFLVYASG